MYEELYLITQDGDKNDDDYTLWSVIIPSDDPLLMALKEKYMYAGYSVRGTWREIKDELEQNE